MAGTSSHTHDVAAMEAELAELQALAAAQGLTIPKGLALGGVVSATRRAAAASSTPPPPPPPPGTPSAFGPRGAAGTAGVPASSPYPHYGDAQVATFDSERAVASPAAAANGSASSGGEAEVDRLRRELQASQAAVEQRDRALAAARAETVGLRTKINARDREAAEMRDEVAKARAQLSDALRSKGSKEARDVEALQAELVARGIDIERLRAELATAEESLAEAEKDTNMKEALLSQYQSQFESLRSELAEAREENATLVALVSDLQAAAEAGEAAMRQLDEQKKAMADLQARLSASEANEEEARQRASSADKLAASAPVVLPQDDGNGGRRDQRRKEHAQTRQSTSEASRQRESRRARSSSAGRGSKRAPKPAAPTRAFVVRRQTAGGGSITVEHGTDADGQPSERHIMKKSAIEKLSKASLKDSDDEVEILLDSSDESGLEIEISPASEQRTRSRSKSGGHRRSSSRPHRRSRGRSLASRPSTGGGAVAALSAELQGSRRLSFGGALTTMRAITTMKKMVQRRQTLRAIGGGQVKKARPKRSRARDHRRSRTSTNGTLSPTAHEMSAAYTRSFLKSVPLFQSLSEEQLDVLVSKTAHKEFTDDDIIIAQGEDGDKFYVIERGSVRVEKDGKELVRLAQGDFFGERALLKNDKRAATCISVGAVHCLTVGRDVFTEVLSGVKSLLGDTVKSYAEDNSEVLSLANFLGLFGGVIQSLNLGGDDVQPSDGAAGAPQMALEDASAAAAGRPRAASASAVEVGASRSSSTAAERRRGSQLRAAARRGSWRAQTRSQVLELMSAFSPELNVSDVIDKFVLQVKSLFRIDRVGLFLVDHESKTMLLKVSKHLRGARIPLAGLAGHVAVSGEILNIKDCYKDKRFDRKMDRREGYRTRTMLCVPIYGEATDETLAVLQLINRQDSSPFTEEDEDLLLFMGDMLGYTLGNLQEEMSLDSDASYIPIWRADEDSFRVHVAQTTNLLLAKKRGAFGIGSGSHTISVMMEVYHGRDRLCAPAFSNQHTADVSKEVSTVDPAAASGGADEDGDDDGPRQVLKGSAEIDEWLNAGIQLRNLPRASRVIFTVMEAGKTPVAWAACTVFEFNQHMKSGTMNLKLFPGACPTPMVTKLTNKHGTDPAELKIAFENFGKPVIFTDYGLTDDSRDITEEDIPPELPERHPLQKVLAYDPLHELTKEERDAVWDARWDLRGSSKALPKFLSSVEWHHRESVQEAYRLLNAWARPGPLEALQLLDAGYPDPKVRAYAVGCLGRLPDESLAKYILQLTQVLKFEPFHDSALARFLLMRSLVSPYHVGHVFFWYLKAEMHIPDARDRFSVLLEQYLRNCGQHRTALGHQMFVQSKLQEVSIAVKETESHAKRRDVCRTEVGKIVFPDSFQLPLHPEFRASGVVVEKCKVMNSKKLPLWLVFRCADGEDVPDLYVMFKNGDDLRQDQLTLQVLSIMDELWKRAGLDLQMNPYGCVSTGDMIGMLELVQNSETIANIVLSQIDPSLSGMKRKLAASQKVYDTDYISRWLKEECLAALQGDVAGGAGGSGGHSRSLPSVVRGNRSGHAGRARALRHAAVAAAHSLSVAVDGDDARALKGARSPYSQAQINFAHSCAGYCVATYVLGIGDRHSDNIMLRRDGKFFHIDFGHFLGNFKTKKIIGYKVKREKAPFVFTPAMAHVLGTAEGEPYKLFVKLACEAYNVLRRHADLLITLFSLMTSCGIPELQTPDDIAWLREHLHIEMTREQADAHMREVIDEALHCKTTQHNDAAHMLRVA